MKRNPVLKDSKNSSMSLKQLIAALQILTGDLSTKSLEENKQLAELSVSVFAQLYKPNFSETANYKPLAIGQEILLIEYTIRRNMLHQMIKLFDAGAYEKKSIEDCWEDYLIANKYNYGSYICAGVSWNGDSIAPLFIGKVIPLLVTKIKEKLTKGQSPKKQKYIKMLLGINARTNSSDPSHEKALQIANFFGKIPQNEYI